VRRRSRTFILFLSLPYSGCVRGLVRGVTGEVVGYVVVTGGEFIREEIMSEEVELHRDTKEQLSSVDDGWPSWVRC
jgi:hypothetical protein